MATELAVREVNVEELQQTARLLAMSGFFDTKGTLEAAVAQLATKILAGREYGFGPYASASGIHVIQGKPTLSGNLLATMVKSSGKYNYRVTELTDDLCKIEFFEGKTPIGVSSFSADDAKRAGTQNMSKFPRNMLFNRAMSNGVRWYCPDVTNGTAVYVPEDFDVAEGNGDYIESTGRVVEPEPALASAETIKLLHVAGKALYGADAWKADGQNHLEEMTGKRSPKELTEAEALNVIGELNRAIAENAEQEELAH